MFLPLSLLASFSNIYMIFLQSNLHHELLKFCNGDATEFLSKKTGEVHLHY